MEARRRGKFPSVFVSTVAKFLKQTTTTRLTPTTVNESLWLLLSVTTASSSSNCMCSHHHCTYTPMKRLCLVPRLPSLTGKHVWKWDYACIQVSSIHAYVHVNTQVLVWTEQLPVVKTRWLNAARFVRSQHDTTWHIMCACVPNMTTANIQTYTAAAFTDLGQHRDNWLLNCSTTS